MALSVMIEFIGNQKIGAFLLVTDHEEFPTVILWYKLADHK